MAETEEDIKPIDAEQQMESDEGSAPDDQSEQPAKQSKSKPAKKAKAKSKGKKASDSVTDEPLEEDSAPESVPESMDDVDTSGMTEEEIADMEQRVKEERLRRVQGSVSLGDISEDDFISYLDDIADNGEVNEEDLVTLKTHYPDADIQIENNTDLAFGDGDDGAKRPNPFAKEEKTPVSPIKVQDSYASLDITEETPEIQADVDTLTHTLRNPFANQVQNDKPTLDTLADMSDETPKSPKAPIEKSVEKPTDTQAKGILKSKLNPDEHPVPQMELGVSQEELNARLAIRLMETPVPEFDSVELSQKVVMDTESPQPIHSNLLSKLDMVDHAFFTRRGGVSSGEYFSLNTGFHASDEMDRVLHNRLLATQMVNKDLELKDLFLVRQRHTPLVYSIEDDTPFGGDAPIADAMVTNKPGVALGILTADCIPVIFADPINHVIGIAHCGWRGAINGITTHTVIAMESLGAVRSNIYASLGPGISQQNYEIGQDLYSLFLAQDLTNKRFFKQMDVDDSRQIFTQSSIPANPYFFDLQGYVLERLRPLGLKDVEMVDLCTYGNEDLLFSHRRESRRGLRAGRQISIVSLNSERKGDGGEEEIQHASKSAEIFYKIRRRLSGWLPRYEEYEFVTHSDNTERHDRVVSIIKDMKERYGQIEFVEEKEDKPKPQAPKDGVAEGPAFSEDEKRERLAKLGAAAAQLKGNFARKPRKAGANPAMASSNPPPEPVETAKKAGAKKTKAKKKTAKKTDAKKAEAKKSKAKKSEDKPVDGGDDVSVDDAVVDTPADTPVDDTPSDTATEQTNNDA